MVSRPARAAAAPDLPPCERGFVVTRTTPSAGGADILVIGAGLAGLCSAAAIVRQGMTVLLLESNERGQASSAAAGMLAPGVERSAGAAHRFALAARDHYPAFIEALATVTGMRVQLSRAGVLEVALSERAADAQRRLLPPGAEWLDAAAVAGLEPALAHVAGAILHPADGFVDNVALVAALRSLLDRDRLVTLRPARAAAISFSGQAARVHTESGDSYEAGAIVLAAGAWSSGIAGLPRPLPIEPVRGEMIALSEAGTGPALRHATYGPRGYVVPRATETLVGSTMDRVGFDARTTEQARAELQAAAAEISPSLGALQVVRQWAGIRPLTPDGLPILGRDPDRERLLYACGHSRNGILLGPLTGDCVAALAAGGTPAYDLRPFVVTRFGDSG